MNLNNLITISKILCIVDVLKVVDENRHAFILGYGQIKAFLDCYYEYLAITDIDLALAINKTSKVPQSLLKGMMNIDKFEDSEIIHQPFGVVFQGNNKKGKLIKVLFQVNDIERYKNSHFFKSFNPYQLLQEE